MNRDSYPYQFDTFVNRWTLWKKGGRRTRQAAQQDARMLLSRLTDHDGKTVEWSQLSQAARELLQGYCTDLTQNIGWYERAILRTRILQWFLNASIIAFGAFSIYVMVELLPEKRNVAFAQASVMLGCLLAVLHVLASTVDTRTRLANFRKASSDLKAALYELEDTWYLRNAEFTGPTVSNEFRAAIEQGRRRARQIEQDERTAFFNSLKSPADLLASVTGAIEIVRGRRLEYQGAQREAERVAKERDTNIAASLAQALRSVTLEVETLRADPARASALAEAERRQRETMEALLRALGK